MPVRRQRSSRIWAQELIPDFESNKPVAGRTKVGKLTVDEYRTSLFPACELRSGYEEIRTDKVDVALNPTELVVRNL